MKWICTIVMLLAVAEVASAQTVPLPRPRPLTAAVGAPLVAPVPKPSACRLRLTPTYAIAPSIAPIEGPGECGSSDLVRLEAIVLPDSSRVAISPPAKLGCEMAQEIALWVREDLAPQARALGSPLQSIQNYASYHCRGRNNVLGAPISEHAKGNALDIRSVRLADGRRIMPTDPQVSKAFREGWRKSVCARFTTVLGPGSDGYHESHIHVDLMRRRSSYRICHWDVRVPEAKPTEAARSVPLPSPRPRFEQLRLRRL